MKYNFDEIILRENTNCVKYDLRKAYFGDENVLPLWVADMDFACADFIQEAIIERANHPIYGYSILPDTLYSAISGWVQRRHKWDIDKSWISFSPGIVPALNIAIMAFSQPGDKVIVQPPVYFPFFSAVRNNKRELVYNQLKEQDGIYEMDFDDLEKKIDNKTKILLLCHPQNPGGRVWKKDVLEKLVEICAKNNIIIISDEIHSDIMLNGRIHLPLASISKTASNICVTCLAPSKTFNLAGMASSVVIIPDSQLKKTFDKKIEQIHIGAGNLFGNIAMQSAYERGDEWLDQLLKYLEINLELIRKFFIDRIPNVKLMVPEATYMVWLDFREFHLSDRDLKNFIIRSAGLGLSDGPVFGPGGKGFQRLNFALPKAKLLIALEQLEKAVNTLGK